MMPDIVLKDRDGNPVTYPGVNALELVLADGTTERFTAGGGGDLFINHMNDDGSELLYAKPIMYGDTAGNAIALGMMEEPYKENTETVEYEFLGWTDSIGGAVKTTMFENVTEDRTVYAVFKSTVIVARGECGETATWKLDENGCLTISGTGAMANYSTNNQPWVEYASTIKSVVIEEGITTIGNFAFFKQYTNLSSVTIPDGITTIGSYAFRYCSNLTSINIPATVTRIDSTAFLDCSGLTEVNVATDNAYYSSAGGVLYDVAKITLILYPTNKTGTTFIIPTSVTSISGSAFFGCKNLTSVTLPDNLESIGSMAFQNCTSLKSIIIPAKVTKIDGAFQNCTSLTSATFRVTSGWTASIFFGGSYTLSASSLANTSTAATYLRSTYAAYTWTRT